MSRGTVQPKLANMLTSMSGVSATNLFLGDPENIPDMNLPAVVLRVQQPQYERLTMGVAGIIKAIYDADMNVLLGPPDMNRQDAETAQLDWSDKFRSLFGGDETVATTAFDSSLYEGNDNLDTYRDTGAYPQLTFRLRIEEHIVKNSAPT